MNTSEEAKLIEHNNKMDKFFDIMLDGNILDITLYLQTKVNIDDLFSGVSILQYAASECTPEVLETVLMFSPNVNYVDQHNRNALHFATDKLSFQKMELLIKAGINPNVTAVMGSTPLNQLIIQNKQDAKLIAHIELLLKYGADPNFSNKQDSRPLAVALRQGSYECVCMLVEYGADPMQLKNPEKTLKDLYTLYDIDYTPKEQTQDPEYEIER